MIFRNDIVILRVIYLRLIAFVYLIAFVSIYVQIPTLWGSNGVLPVQWYMKRVEPQLIKDVSVDEQKHFMTYLTKYLTVHTLLWFQPYFNSYVLPFLPSNMQQFKPLDSLMHLLVLWGIIFSLLLFVGRPKILMNSFSYFMLWLLYLSHVSVGDRFMSFQWDILLLETGFLATLFAPLWHTDIYDITPTVSLVRELHRWFIFRFMLANGLVKLLSRCETWWSLTALHYHIETQPLPHGLSWYLGQLPDIMKQYGVVANFIIEVFLPFLFYSPFRNHRIVASALTSFLMLNIMISGNFNFFNIHTSILTLIVLDDQFILSVTPVFVLKMFGIQIPKQYLKKDLANTTSIFYMLYNFFSSIISWALLSAFFYLMLGKLFPYDLVKLSKFNFTYNDLQSYLQDKDYQVELFVYVLVFSITVLLIDSLRWLHKNSDNILYVFSTSITFTAALLFSYYLFIGSSYVFLKSIEIQPEKVPLFPAQQAQLLAQNTQSLHLFNSYGVFRKITGVGGRPEIIMKGSNDLETWKEYEFYYKPTNVAKRPKLVLPHQPRFDWQLWFSALGTVNSEFYLVHFVYKILTNDKHALSLIEDNPFKDQPPPKYIKLDLYHYHFTDYQSQKVTFGLKNYFKYIQSFVTDKKQIRFFNKVEQDKWVPDEWWSRKDINKAYLQPVDKLVLADFIKNNKLGFYNQDPNAPVHILQKLPVIETCVGLTIVVFIWNLLFTKNLYKKKQDTRVVEQIVEQEETVVKKTTVIKRVEKSGQEKEEDKQAQRTPGYKVKQ